jgi:hypothetical protein
MSTHGEFLEQFLLDAHKLQLDRKEKLNAGLSIPMSAVGILFAALSYIGSHMPLPSWRPLTVIQIGGYGVALVGLAWGVCWLILVMRSRSYGRMQTPQETVEYVTRLDAYYTAANSANKDDMIRGDLQKFFIELAAKTATYNELQNDYREWQRDQAYAGIAVALFGLVVTLIAFALNQFVQATISSP